MCTMTVLPLPGERVRVAFNRDESRDRPAALPPVRRRFGRREAVLPIDPHSEGTWIGANDAGLILALLNGNPPHPVRQRAARSRGHIVPESLCCDSPADALDRFERLLQPSDFAPFRLVVLGRGLVADIRWDGQQSMVSSRLLGGTPVLFTSSGLGDHLVEAPRRELFEMLFENAHDPVAAQDAFHAHRWPGREHLSVSMERADARTVSRSLIVRDERAVQFEYFADADSTYHESLSLSGARS
jgi:uncharacterized protein with NRDE domain